MYALTLLAVLFWGHTGKIGSQVPLFTPLILCMSQVKARLMGNLKGSYGKVAMTAAGSFVVERCYNWGVRQLVWEV